LGPPPPVTLEGFDCCGMKKAPLAPRSASEPNPKGRNWFLAAFENRALRRSPRPYDICPKPPTNPYGGPGPHPVWGPAVLPTHSRGAGMLATNPDAARASPMVPPPPSPTKAPPQTVPPCPGPGSRRMPAFCLPPNAFYVPNPPRPNGFGFGRRSTGRRKPPAPVPRLVPSRTIPLLGTACLRRKGPFPRISPQALEPPAGTVDAPSARLARPAMAGAAGGSRTDQAPEMRGANPTAPMRGGRCPPPALIPGPPEAPTGTVGPVGGTREYQTGPSARPSPLARQFPRARYRHLRPQSRYQCSDAALAPANEPGSGRTGPTQWPSVVSLPPSVKAT